MDVEIVSVEMIKPSIPTPNHLKNFKLCSLDQLIPAAYAPFVIYYPNNDSSSPSTTLERLFTLKRALSETLTRFYPLAGVIKDDLSIDCDDHGACFTTAKVNKYRMSDFLASPDLKLIDKFLPCGLESIGYCMTNIQVSIFECGGIAIGICVSHKILDGVATSTFLKSWATSVTSCNDKSHVFPDFSASSLFPVNDTTLKDAMIATRDSLFKKGQYVTKRFVFDGPAIANLKERAASHTRSTRPSTRVETVSAFIWKCAIESSQVPPCPHKPSLLTHIVNLRKKASPNFPENSIGNLIWMASKKLEATKIRDVEFHDLVDEVGKCIAAIDSDYVNKLRGDNGLLIMREHMKEIEELGRAGVDHYGFSSWCKLGFYDVDFGWGKPTWVTSIAASCSFFMNLVILMDTKCGNGIEAWVTLDKEQMDVLERNQEFRALASLNTSPLDIISK